MKRNSFRVALSGVAVAATAFLVSNVHADLNSAETLAKEVHTSVSAATSVIGGMQPAINGGSVDATAIEPDAVVAAFMAAYEKKTGQTFDMAADGNVGSYRQILVESIREVMQEYEGDIVKGGQDAFVPAFFRNQILVRVNERMNGKLIAAVMNREDELINIDSSVGNVFDDAGIADHVAAMLDRGTQDASSQTIEGNLVTYWPMKLKESCVSCHARSGVEQQVGAFGGAMVIIVDPSS